MVRWEDHGRFRDWKTFASDLIKLYSKVGSSSLDEEEEGSVL